MIKTEFMELLEELDRINEETFGGYPEEKSALKANIEMQQREILEKAYKEALPKALKLVDQELLAEYKTMYDADDGDINLEIKPKFRVRNEMIITPGPKVGYHYNYYNPMNITGDKVKPLAQILTDFFKFAIRQRKAELGLAKTTPAEEINEATDINASKRFWADAKEGKLNDQAFKKAFKDELETLNLWSLIDEEYYSSSRFYTPTHTGSLKDKSSYGAIKKAAEANPDSWAVKAMLKMWVLQFKDRVKSNSQLAMEKEQEASAKRKQDYDANKAAYEAAKEEFKDNYVQKVTDIVNKVATDFASKAYETAKATVEKMMKFATDTEALSKGFIKSYPVRDTQALLNLSSDDIVGVYCSVEDNKYFAFGTYPTNPEFKIKVQVSKFLNESRVKGFEYGKGFEYSYCYLRPEDCTEEVITKKVLEILEPMSQNKLAELKKSLAWYQKSFDGLNKKVAAAKAAQAAVDADKPVDPNFIKDILSLFKDGLDSASRSAGIWSDSTSDNKAVAYLLGLHDSVKSIAPALLYCNWRAVLEGKEIATWRMTDSTDDLEDALGDALNTFERNKDLTIEIIK